MNTEEKHALAEQAYQKALRYELDYGCCPQCVLAVVQDRRGRARAAAAGDHTVFAEAGGDGTRGCGKEISPTGLNCSTEEAIIIPDSGN